MTRWQQGWDKHRRSFLYSGAIHLGLLVALSLIVYHARPPQEKLIVELSWQDVEPTPMESEAIMMETLPSPASKLHEPDVQKPIPFEEPEQVETETAPEKPAAESSTVGDVLSQHLAAVGGRQGEINFLLLWRSVSDLDLILTLPSGERISYENPQTHGAVKDLDANAKVGDARFSNRPIENIYVPEGHAQLGTYVVAVQLARRRNEAGAIPFRVQVVMRGKETRVFERQFEATSARNSILLICRLELTASGQILWHESDSAAHGRNGATEGLDYGDEDQSEKISRSKH